MIGRNPTLMDTGAPSPADVRQLELDQTIRFRRELAAAGPRTQSIRSAIVHALFTMKGRWRAGPVRPTRELAAVSLFLVSLSWGIPWFRALSAATADVPAGAAFTIFGAIGAAAYLLVRVMAGFQIAPRTRRYALLGLIAMSMAFGLRTILYAKETISPAELILRPLWALGNFSSLIPNEVIVLVAVLLVLRRGAALALDHLGPSRAQSEFKTGIVMFLLFAAINTTATGEQIPDGNLLLFIYTGLTAMGAARLDSIGELRGGVRSGFDRRRFISMLAGVSLSAAAAYRIGQAFGQDGGALAGYAIGAAVAAVFLVSLPLLLGVLYLLYFVAALFENELSQAFERLVDAVNDLLAFLETFKEMILAAGAYLAERLAFLAPVFRALISLTPTVRIFVLSAAIVVPVILVLATLLIRTSRRSGRDQTEVASSLDLGGILGRLRSRARELFRDRRTAFALFGPARRQRIMAARIRRLYAKLIALAEEMGRPMRAAQTPDEFSLDMQKLIPDEAAAIALMTRAYERIRYGELPEDGTEIERVGRAWASIRGAVRKSRTSVRR